MNPISSMWGLYGIRILENSGTETENMASQPKIWRTNPQCHTSEPILWGVGWSPSSWKWVHGGQGPEFMTSAPPVPGILRLTKSQNFTNTLGLKPAFPIGDGNRGLYNKGSFRWGESPESLNSLEFLEPLEFSTLRNLVDLITTSHLQWRLHHCLHRSGFPRRERKPQWKCIASQRWFPYMMNFEILGVKNMVETWWLIFCQSSPGKRLKICHRRFHQILHCKKRNLSPGTYSGSILTKIFCDWIIHIALHKSFLRCTWQCINRLFWSHLRPLRSCAHRGLQKLIASQIKTSPNPERGQNRRFPEKSRLGGQQIVALSWCEFACLQLNSSLFIGAVWSTSSPIRCPPGCCRTVVTKPRSWPKIESNFEALSWVFLEEKPHNSNEPGGLVNSLVSGTPKT